MSLLKVCEKGDSETVCGFESSKTKRWVKEQGLFKQTMIEAGVIEDKKHFLSSI